MQQRLQLIGQERTILGKKVQQLRRQGFLPAHVYGHQIASLSVTIPAREFTRVFAKTGETGLIDLAVGDGAPRPVLINAVQKDPLTRLPVHVDFYQVNLKEKVTVNVPLEISGEAPAVKENLGVLLQELSELSIEALPTDLPEKIIVDVSNLAAVGDALAVKDLPTPAGVTVLSDPEQFVAHIGALAALEEEVKPVIETPVEVGEAGTQETGAGTEEQSKSQPAE